MIAHEFHRLAEERVPDDELEKSRALAKGRFVLQTESPNGLMLFGLRREVLEGRAAEPEELLAGLDAVTAEDVQRVAQDVIGSTGMRVAVIGPFDDEEPFRTALAADLERDGSSVALSAASSGRRRGACGRRRRRSRPPAPARRTARPPRGRPR